MTASAIKNYEFKGIKCIKLETENYFAVVANSIGSSVLRLRDTKNNAEIFRYNEETTIEEINNAREIWGLPTLFYPNRFDKGMLKTSDAVYNLPVNETNLNNHLHGWVHKRTHKIEKCQVDGDKAMAITSYTFDKHDEMYKYFPVDFKITYTFTLSNEGLTHEVSITNLSDKKLPISLCTHTCINAPVWDNVEQSKLRLSVPIVEKCQLNERCLPTEKLVPLSDWDMEYKNGTKMPTLQDISNDMYTACLNTLDGEDFYGAVVTNLENNLKLCNEVSKEYIFWNMWNHDGDKGYFCPEPMTAMINAPNLSLPNEITGYNELSKDETFSCWQKFYIK